MTRKLVIQPIKLANLDENGDETSASYGIRLTDPNGSYLSAALRRDQVIGASPRDLVEIATAIDEATESLMEDATDDYEGIYIGERFYPWNSIYDETPAP